MPRTKGSKNKSKEETVAEIEEKVETDPYYLGSNADGRWSNKRGWRKRR